MKKISIYKNSKVFYVVFVISIGLLYYYSYNQKDILENCIEANEKYKEQNSILLQNLINTYSIHKLVTNNKVMFYSQSGKEIILQDLITAPKIALRYPEHACDCFDELLISLRKLSKDKKDEIIIFVPKTKIRYYISLFSDNGIKDFTMVATDKNVKFTLLDDGLTPYFFVIDTEMVCKGFLVPIHNHFSILDTFLKNAINIYSYSIK